MTKFRNFSLLLSFIAALGFSLPAWAQALPAAVNGPASPGRAQHDVPEQEPIPQQTVPNIQIRPLSIQSAPKGAEKIVFKLHSITLEGNKTYPVAKISTVYASKLGKTVSLADIYGIAADITRKYRNDGYILTQVVVPPQEINSGNVKLRVVEGYIDHVEVKGFDSPVAMRQVQAYADKVASNGQALNIRDLERAMLLINDLPGMQAQGILSPSANNTGAADLLITTNRKAYDAQVGIDNYGSRFLGPWQISASGTLNSAFGVNDRLTAQLVTAPGYGLDSSLWYGGLDYEQPIFSNGMSIETFASDTITHPEYLLRQFDVHGDAQQVGVRLKDPIIRTRALTITGRVSTDLDDVTSEDNIESSRDDRIRTARLGGHVDYLDTFIGSAYDTLDLELSQGIDWLGATGKDDTRVSRVGAIPDYRKIAGEIQRLQELTPHINILVAATGQFSDDQLYTAEQFSIGGTNYGRGFDPSEITGDSGYAAKAELQWNEPYRLPYITKYQLFTFYDAGTVWDNNAVVDADKRSSLASVGGGFPD